ncbi:MAG: DMT family transporter [Rhodospirillaceae bacterium]|nr:DMT family transporter [Rhodospirillaceae bacterium]MBT5455643.1 DMT family transporter [Rhodospirillaceae bacterium]
MLLTTLSFVAMNVSIRALAGEISAVEILFFRCVIGVMIFLPWIAKNGMGVLHTQKFGHHAIRAVMMGAGMMFWFVAIAALPLGDAIALHFTLPLFLIVFAALFLKEKVDWSVWLATALGFSGVLLILRPGFQEFNIAMIYVLISGALYGGNHCITKAMSTTESPNATAFYMNLLILPGSAIALPFYWVMPQWHHVGWILLIGFAGSSAHVCLLRAFRYADANVLAPIDFLRLVFAATAAYFLFGDVSGIMTWVGACVIFMAAYYSTWRAQKLDQQAKAQAAQPASAQ